MESRPLEILSELYDRLLRKSKDKQAGYSEKSASPALHKGGLVTGDPGERHS